MNDEIEAAQRTGWGRFVTGLEVWAPRIGVVAMIVMGVAVYLYGEEIPEGVHCATEKGNVTCVEHYGGDQPYCDRSTTNYHGCISELPLPEYGSSCGQLKAGLPGDPDCSKIVADNPPSVETLAKRRQAASVDKIVETIKVVLGLGLFFGVIFWTYGRIIIRSHARSAHQRQAVELAVMMSKNDVLDESKDQVP